MKEIEDFKKENGNISYTTKELIGALHIKFDKLVECQTNTDKKVSKLVAWNSAFKWIIGSIGLVLLKLVFF